MSTTAKVPWYDKIIHSMYGAYSFQVSWVIFGYYLVYFYTDVVGLSATVAGTIMLVAMFAFTVALMIGVFLMKPLIKLFRDTGRAYQICMAASAGFSILLFVLCKQYCYHCDFGKEPGSCNMQCLKYLEQTMLHEGGDKIAAVISEPIFAAGGVIVPPKGFWQGVRDLCDKYGALLIFDEVVTGIGQTGTMFACEYEGVTPDILVTGKGLTSGYVPGSAVLCRREIGEAMSKISLHGHTHSCYPMTCRSALKNIEIIERENLVENSRVVGDYLHEKLKGLMEKYDVIKDVRGRGLLQGIELEGSRNADKYVLGQKFYETMLGNGLITELESRRNLENVVVVMHPALITSKENVDEAVEIIDKSLKVCLN